MTQDINHLGQPVGPLLADWVVPPALEATILAGRYCRLEPMADSPHLPSLSEAFSEDTDGAMWTYLGSPPLDTLEKVRGFPEYAAAKGWEPLVIIDTASGRCVGSASYMRIDAANGSAEIGSVMYAPALQRTRAGTEAIYLMMDHMFSLGYRRSEWKCNALNEASCRAALRYGFSYEGIFRNAAVVRGRSRDTAWYACTDADWPPVKAAFTRWLSPENFGDDGRQKERLSDLTRPLLR